MARVFGGGEGCLGEGLVRVGWLGWLECLGRGWLECLGEGRAG